MVHYIYYTLHSGLQEDSDREELDRELEAPSATEVKREDGTPMWWQGEEEAGAGIAARFNVDAFIQAVNEEEEEANGERSDS